MNKKLVYNFYLEEDSFEKDIIKLHLRCLEKYLPIFDEVSVAISKEEFVSKENILKLEEFFLQNFKGKKITFDILPNQEFRESYYFNKEIIEKLGEDKLVFFAHNKGITNVEKYEKRNTFIWVVGMYYYSLNFIEEMEYDLVSRPYISYGSFLTQVEPVKNLQRPKYGWCYIGTYFWINSGKLKDYIDLHNIKAPQCTDRFFDEEYLGNIYPMFPSLAASHEQRYILNADDYYHYVENYLHTLYDEASDFYEVYNEVTNF